MANTNHNIAGSDKSKNLSHASNTKGLAGMDKSKELSQSFSISSFFNMMVKKAMIGTQMFGSVPILGSAINSSFLTGSKTLQRPVQMLGVKYLKKP